MASFDPRVREAHTPGAPDGWQDADLGAKITTAIVLAALASLALLLLVPLLGGLDGLLGR